MKPVLVVISGGTASGKSTLTNAFAAQVDALHIRHDDYYFDVPAADRNYNFDHPDALESDLLVKNLRALLQGQSVALPQYEFRTHTRSPIPRPVEPHPLILVEGILALGLADVRALASLRVFVHADEEVRRTRRIQREISSWGRNHEEAIYRWNNTVKPMHDRFVEPARSHADLVISGEQPLALGLEQLAAAITGLRLGSQG